MKIQNHIAIPILALLSALALTMLLKLAGFVSAVAVLASVGWHG